MAFARRSDRLHAEERWTWMNESSIERISSDEGDR